MLKIFDSNAENTAIECVLQELQKNNLAGTEHIILTPDRFSLSVEKKLFEYLHLDGTMNINVYSFTNFAKRAVKGLPRCLTKEGTVMLLKEVIAAEAKNLCYYRNVLGMKSFPKELFAVIASIRNSGISPSMLLTALGESHDTTALKYRDIALLYRRYQEELQKKYIDTTGRLDALVEAAGQTRQVTDSHFYVVGFTNFYKKQLQMLEALTKYAKSVNISCCTSSGGSNAPLYGTRFLQTMREIQQRTGSDFKLTRVEKPLTEPIATLVKNVFSYRAGQLPPSKNVVLYCENTPYDEVKAVGREIMRLVRRCGYRFKDIAVVHYDDSQKTVVRDVFQRFGIPFFSDEKYPLRTAMSVRYLTEALAVVAENYRREAVLAFVKNPLFPSSRAETDAFENYVLQYNINFKGFLEPFHYGKAQVLEACEATRQKLCAELPQFLEPLTVVSAAEVLRAFLSEDLLLREAEATRFADAAYRKLHEQAVRLFSEQLDEMQEVLGAKPVTLAEFRDMVLSAILSVSVSLIPAKNDCVFVGSGEESALFDIKVLFLVGAAEGVVPQIGGYQAIMPERDVLMFERAGLPLYPTPIDRLKQEKVKLINLLSKAEERLYVGYSAFNLISEPARASELLKELCAESGWKLDKLSSHFAVHEGMSEQAEEDFLVSCENARYEYRFWRGRAEQKNVEFFGRVKRYLAAQGIAAEDEVSAYQNLKFGKEELFFKVEGGVYTTTASQLQDFATCPYRHFFDYGLRVKEREEAEAKKTDIGTIIHRALEIYFKNTLAKLHQMPQQEVLNETKKAIAQTFQEEKAEILKDSNLGKILFATLENELTAMLPKLTEFVQNSKFEPRFLELPFRNADGNAICLATDFGTLAINGKIDRADVYGNKAFVVDYKTGVASADLKDAYEGRNVQLYLYALPLRAKGYQVVGAYYLPLPSGFSKSGKEYALLGNTLLNTSHMVSELDTGFVEDKWSSAFFPLKNKITKKDGLTVVAKAKSRVLEAQQWQVVEDNVLGVVRNCSEEMQGGYILKRPMQGTCQSCKFQPLCADAEARKSRNVKLVGNGLVRNMAEDFCEDGEEGSDL